jgi:hypothetical protein
VQSCCMGHGIWLGEDGDSGVPKAEASVVALDHIDVEGLYERVSVREFDFYRLEKPNGEDFQARPGESPLPSSTATDDRTCTASSTAVFGNDSPIANIVSQRLDGRCP